MAARGGGGERAAAAAAAKAAQRMHRQVSRMDRKAVEALFPASQRQQWPASYLPASGVAHFLHPDGVPVLDVIECYREMKQQQQQQQQGGGAAAEIQRDFASDYTLWTRGVLEDFVRLLGRRRQRLFRQFVDRQRLPPDGAVRELFHLGPYAPPAPPDSGGGGGGAAAAGKDGAGAAQHYSFTPYAALQHFAMLPIESQLPPPTPHARVRLGTFPQIRNILQTDYDSMSPLRATCLYAGEELVLTREAVQQTARYLRRRLEEIAAAEDAFLASGKHSPPPPGTTGQDANITINNNNNNDSSGGGGGGGDGDGAVRGDSAAAAAAAAALPAVPTFSRETPIMCIFGTGRLAWALNDSGVLGGAAAAAAAATAAAPLGTRVVSVQTPAQAARRERRQRQLLASSFMRDNPLLRGAFTGDGGERAAGGDLAASEAMSVGDALRRYRPALVVVEPHVDRDWLADLRGFYSVREVLCLGPVDSPAMGSFAYPFLSFGVTPGPDSYWVYNEQLMKVAASARVQMPMDPPHVSQGYEKVYRDGELSSWLISPNDTGAIGGQYRALAFVRKVCPAPRPPPPPSGKRTATTTS